MTTTTDPVVEPVVDMNTLGIQGIHIERADTVNKWKTFWQIRRYTIWCLYICIGTIMLGYDFSAFGNMLAYESFAQKYGTYDPATKSYIISANVQAAWNSVSNLAQVLGGFSSGYMLDKFGRKNQYLLASCVGVVGIGIIYAAPDWKVLTAGRLILGLGIGFIATFSPVYIGENSVPELRGLFLCTYDSFIVLGQFMVAIVSRAVVNVQGQWQYRSLILSIYFFNVILTVIWPFFPESPYYLLSKKKDREGCRKSLRRLYGGGMDGFIENEIIRLEHNIAASAAIWKLDAVQPTFHEQFRRAFQGQNLKRTLTAAAAAAAQQFSGIIFVVGFLPYFLSLAGISNVFNWNMYMNTVAICGNLVSYYNIERFGRRKLIITGLAVMSICNLIIGFLNISVSATKLYASVGFIYVFAFAFQTTIGPLGLAFASEIGSLPMRHVTQSIVSMSQAFWSWVFQVTIPYMINPNSGNLGGKVGFIFGGLGCISTTVAFFYFPETVGLTYSEMDLLYAEKTSPRKFTKVIQAKRAMGLIEEDVHHQNAALEQADGGLDVGTDVKGASAVTHVEDKSM